MTPRGRALLVLTCLGIVAGMTTGHARTLETRAKHLAWMNSKPMVFFVAKGAPNACGPGCSQWIAAQGNVDDKSAARFRAFLARTQRYDLPVFFHSDGGLNGDGMQIARVLREHRMAVGVGRTTPAGCREEDLPGQDCRRLIEKKVEHSARLKTKAARCRSACIAAVIGGSVRRFAPDALLGVHVPGWSDEPMDSPAIRSRAHALRIHYAEYGVDPGLVDLGLKTSQRSIHYLSRDEADRFGMPTRGYFETRWALSPQPDRQTRVLKAWTRPLGAKGDEFIAANISLACSGRRQDRVAINYRRDVPRNEIGIRWNIKLVVGEEERTISVARTTAADESMSTNVPLAAIRQAEKITIEESFWTETDRWTRTTNLSTAGLSEALTVLEKNCAPTTVAEPGQGQQAPVGSAEPVRWLTPAPAGVTQVRSGSEPSRPPSEPPPGSGGREADPSP